MDRGNDRTGSGSFTALFGTIYLQNTLLSLQSLNPPVRALLAARGKTKVNNTLQLLTSKLMSNHFFVLRRSPKLRN